MVDGESTITGLQERFAELDEEALQKPSNVLPEFDTDAGAKGLQILLVAMRASPHGGNTLISTGQLKADGTFDGPTPVSDGVYEPVLDSAIVTDGRAGLAAIRHGDKGVDLILQKKGESQAGPQVQGVPGEDWDPPFDVGRPAGVEFKALQLGLDAQGRIALFGLSTSGEVWWLYKRPPQAVPTEVTITPPGTQTPITITVDELKPADPPFSAWQKLEGPALSRFTLTNNADDRILLFGVGEAGGDVIYNEPKTLNAATPADWAGWSELTPGGATPFGPVTASIDSVNVINLFAVDHHAEVSHSSQVRPGVRKWTGYTRPGLVMDGVSCLTCGLDGNDNVALAAYSSGGTVWTNQELVAETGHWTGWQPSVKASMVKALSLQFAGDNSLVLFGLAGAEGEVGDVWMVGQAGPTSSEWGATPIKLLDGVTAMVAQRDLRGMPE